jgi:hypothetical protein
MSAADSSPVILAAQVFPLGVDVHWEAQRRVVWNEQECTSEDREFVYEISWIEEPGLWRIFLRPHNKVKG